jgi:peptidoglycan-N-acetylglucosamine deacetylase
MTLDDRIQRLVAAWGDHSQVTQLTRSTTAAPLAWMACAALLISCTGGTLPPKDASAQTGDGSMAPSPRAILSPAATARPPASATPAPVRAGPSQVVTHGDRESDEVALTFTVGYRLDPAVEIVELLRDRRAASTIFMSGVVFDRPATRVIAHRVVEIVDQWPGLFQLGQHGYAVIELSQLDKDSIEKDVLRAERAIGEYTTTDLHPYFSPPGGALSPVALEVLGRLGYTTSVLWDVDPLDWMPPAAGGPSADEIVDRVLGNVQGGSMVLLHLGGWNTAAALPRILDGLAARGYRTVTVADLLVEE